MRPRRSIGANGDERSVYRILHRKRTNTRLILIVLHVITERRMSPINLLGEIFLIVKYKKNGSVVFFEPILEIIRTSEFNIFGKSPFRFGRCFTFITFGPKYSNMTHIPNARLFIAIFQENHSNFFTGDQFFLSNFLYLVVTFQKLVYLL